MLDDQPFLIDSTTFLSQCNRMTITGIYLLVYFGQKIESNDSLFDSFAFDDKAMMSIGNLMRCSYCVFDIRR